MKNSYELADAEQEIMDVLWQYTDPVQTNELLKQMNDRGKAWKRQTLNTLLARLEKKGLVDRKRAYVRALVTEDKLRQMQTREILDKFYGGRLRNFCATLMGGTKLSDEEADELIALIDELKEK